VAPGASPLEILRGRLRAVRRAVEPHFAAVRPVCFLDELTTKNVLVESGTFQGIIDLDSVCYGDPLLAIGSTVALVAAEVGAAGTFYGEELIRCWDPTRDERRAIRFYGALWAVGLLSAAGSPAQAQALTGLADAMLGLAEAV
jgi:aminoglycoside phosphotransferase (APT) family kinase protein